MKFSIVALCSLAGIATAVVVAACSTGDQTVASTTALEAGAPAETSTPQSDASPQSDADAAMAPDVASCDAAVVECSGDMQRTVACGRCGTETQRCGASCAFEDDGLCQGEGPCNPGDQEATSAGCTAGGAYAVRVCDATCQWGTWSACEQHGWREFPPYPGPAESTRGGIWNGTDFVVLDDKTYAFSPTTNAWRTLSIASPPAAVYGESPHALNGRFLLVASVDLSGWVLDKAETAWTAMPAAPAAPPSGVVLMYASVDATDDLVAFGESDALDGTTTDPAAYTLYAFDAYNATSGTWRSIAPFPPSVATGSVSQYATGLGVPAVLGTKVVFLHGTNKTFVYDVVADGWTVLPGPAFDLSFAGRVGLVAIDATHAAYFNQHSGALFDLGTGAWTALPPVTYTLSGDRLGPVSFSDGTSVWFWGGESATASGTTNTETGLQLTLGSGAWQPMPLPGFPLDKPQGGLVWTGTEAVAWSNPTFSGIYRP
jgi:hypothetical protein